MGYQSIIIRSKIENLCNSSLIILKKILPGRVVPVTATDAITCDAGVFQFNSSKEAVIILDTGRKNY